MTSAISTSGLDENFPVAGRDNDSQGFRDNFLNIKNNLTSAAAEITDLQDGVARKDAENNFDGNTQVNLVLNQAAIQRSAEAALGGGDWEEAGIQTWDIDGDSVGDVTVALSNFPNDNYGSIRCFFRNTDSSSHTVTFTATSYTYFYTDGNAAWTTKTLTLDPSEVVVVDAFSPDGDSVYLNYIGTFS